MVDIKKRQDTKDRIKEYLRNLPLLYAVAKRISRLFRRPDISMEEQIVKAIGGKPSVFFVQVGSNDGLQGDPIHDLIITRKSWSGIFIEPVDFIFQRLKKNYGDSERFVFENVAIGSEKGNRKFYYVSDKAKHELQLPYWHDQLGSFDKGHISRMLGDEISPYIIEEDIECLPFQEVLDRNRVDAIDLLHIDTEGFDYQVLSQLDIKRYKPSVILFEHHLLSDEDFVKARKLLHRTGYRLRHYGNDILAIRRALWI